MTKWWICLCLLSSRSTFRQMSLQLITLYLPLCCQSSRWLWPFFRDIQKGFYKFLLYIFMAMPFAHTVVNSFFEKYNLECNSNCNSVLSSFKLNSKHYKSCIFKLSSWLKRYIFPFALEHLKHFFIFGMTSFIFQTLF